MINLDLQYDTTQLVTVTPADRLSCCGATPSFVFRVTSPLTREVQIFLPPQVYAPTLRWQQFHIGLTSTAPSALGGQMRAVTTGTWDYEIWLGPTGATSNPLNPAEWLQRCETGLLQISDIVQQDLPSFGATATIPTYNS